MSKGISFPGLKIENARRRHSMHFLEWAGFLPIGWWS